MDPAQEFVRTEMLICAVFLFIGAAALLGVLLFGRRR